LATKSKNQKRQQAQRHRPRTAAAVRRQRQQQRRRKIITTGGAGSIVLVIVVALAAPSIFGNKNATTTTSPSSSSSSSSTTSTPAKSVKGKPCVAVKGPLPSGAPAVPVQVGKPPTTLVKKDVKVGSGAVVTASQTVTADYIGVSCSTGKIFDSSYKVGGQPLTTSLKSGVIAGWMQGIPGMKVGGRRLLGIPPDLAYGKDGRPPDIAPDETLWYVVTVKSAK
jgi:peptidylprolyl isomerase